MVRPALDPKKHPLKGTMRSSNHLLKKKRTVRLFYCDQIRLGLSELVVYSYRGYQSEYSEQASTPFEPGWARASAPLTCMPRSIWR